MFNRTLAASFMRRAFECRRGNGCLKHSAAQIPALAALAGEATALLRGSQDATVEA
ncbi:hypothetical protein JZ751_006348 [Albula glossodonta]|uniref:Uncharacterized protein n=1 Tax=Albula glossodonta TaxID=121402 RepID=A0A8T2N8A1_9TELE|nr:hypothetical protein JZ751_006348 [Albula glossodonta]